VTVLALPPEPASHIDPETQREVPDDPAALVASIAALTTLLAGGLAPAEELTVRARLGVELRRARRLDEALAVLTEEVALARRMAQPYRVQHARIRLAHVHQWRGEFEVADAQFAELLAAATGLPARTQAFTLQHAGRNAFDQRRWAEAARLFAAALEIRERIGAPADQRESSREALAAARRRMGES
jgi:tetratricopeptide (TPR) repeat protein